MQTTGFLDELSWRGLLHQTTSPELAAHLASGVRAGYAGFDPTSDSLTIGNFIPIKLLAHFQRAGHRPIVVSGGGTGLIGDPSGKSAERQLQTREMVEHNVRSQQRIFDRFLDFSGPRAAKIVNNVDWLSGVSYLDMLRDIGKHFSVNQMIARDSVASRLEGREQGISYTEFSYMILQAYDFLHLFRNERCTVQLGGSDQFGNIVSGIDLIRRIEQGESFGATCHLVTTSDGQKIGKTERGAIWMTADRTSPYRFYQYWLNTADADAVKFLKWFTFLDSDTVQSLAHSLAHDPAKREAAWKYLRFSTSAEGTTLMVKNTGYVPTNQLAIDDPRFLTEFYRENPLFQTATLQVPRMVPWYAFPGANSVRVTEVMVNNMARVVEGNATPEQALGDMASEVRRLLPRRG
jgi:tyrosyl-tRNA synthetase